MWLSLFMSLTAIKEFFSLAILKIARKQYFPESTWTACCSHFLSVRKV